MDNKEKINENLEKIKQLCDVEVPYNEVCSIHANALGEIQESAERMAAEIERQHQDALGNAGLIRLHMHNIRNLESEIARLKAELEKRPEVVRCGECKLRGTDNCWLAEMDDTDDEYETFWEPQTDDNDFCAHGQRRESEEK